MLVAPFTIISRQNILKEKEKIPFSDVSNILYQFQLPFSFLSQNFTLFFLFTNRTRVKIKPNFVKSKSKPSFFSTKDCKLEALFSKIREGRFGDYCLLYFKLCKFKLLISFFTHDQNFDVQMEDLFEKCFLLSRRYQIKFEYFYFHDKNKNTRT